MTTSPTADACKRDRLVLNIVFAHVPFVGVLGALCGQLAAGLITAVVAAALCLLAYAAARGTRMFRVYGGALLMLDSAAVIAASGGQTAMHFHVFIVLTFLILYFDWLPIVAATVTIALHHVIGNLLFSKLVFCDVRTVSESWTMVVVHALAVVLEAAAAIYVAMRIRTSVTTVSEVARAIAQVQLPRFTESITALADGNLTRPAHFEPQRLTIDASDEIGVMAATFDAMQREIEASVDAFERTRGALHDIVAGITASAGELAEAVGAFSGGTAAASAAVESISVASDRVAVNARTQNVALGHAGEALSLLAGSAAAIAQGTGAESTAVRAVVGEVQALDAEIAAVADLGSALTAAAGEASSEAANGIEAVVQTTNAVTQLRDRAAATEQLMSTLESRSSAVGEIVGAIEEIAEQTNLLALNAAIEAARAGDQGRGFAVVADEVRKLAERSATSTREIGQILSAIRRETVEAAASMRASNVEMENGFALATRAKAALSSVEAKIAETMRVAGAIVAGSQTMRSASTRAGSNIVDVSSIIEKNAGAAAESGATATQVRNTLGAVTEHSRAQVAAATDVSTSVLSLLERVGEIGLVAQRVAGQAEELTAVVGHFRLAEAARRPNRSKAAAVGAR